MNDERIAILKSELGDGTLRPGFLCVSRSIYWLPWMMGSVTDRIEVGLFSEYLPDPDGPCFGIEWSSNSEGVSIDVKAPVEAWQILPHLPGFENLLRELAASINESPISAEAFTEALESAGYAASHLADQEEEELPLPPPEPIPEYVGLFGEALGETQPDLVGPHIGRTSRFLRLLDLFVTELVVEGVPAMDIKAGYLDSAFHRLWEGMDFGIVDDSLLAASGRNDVDHVPFAVTDSHAYLITAFGDAERALRHCGLPESADNATLAAPISEVVFQLWQMQPEDHDRMQQAFENAAKRVGLRLIWDEERPTVCLPDLDGFRFHAVSP